MNIFVSPAPDHFSNGLSLTNKGFMNMAEARDGKNILTEYNLYEVFPLEVYSHFKTKWQFSQ